MQLPNQFDETKASVLAEKIKRSQSILITSHYNPDGDAVGSCLALYHYLKTAGKKTKVLIPNVIPDFLLWLEGADKIIIYEDHPGKADKLIESADLIFSVDYNDFKRTKLFEDQLHNSKAFKVLIDHHLSPSNSFDLIHSRIEVSSTAELVYELIVALENEDIINKNIAESLYVGIMTDTGSFSFSCNYSATFSIIAGLIKKGINVEKIHQLVYDTYSENRLRLLGFCLSEKLVVLKDFATAYISLAKHELDQFQFQPGDTEGIVNYALSIENIVFAALFIEKEDIVRISFRSKGEFSVNEFARTHYEGGGHKNAAGADSERSLDETITDFVELLQDYKEELQNLVAEHKL
ncbi:MAG: bifunctional oligoribonuclease/PAP phosphatase NrnA [Bacteroidales bacterium]|jgi:phosphoesterase RecJ-like protein|nr:bifunctional oligoribonuclease/PAP phosphatase NrnA [Bacteroidales bacterium]